MSLRFFKSNLNLNFASQSTISAFVIAPTGKLYYVRNTREDNLVLPYLKGEYYVVFSGATADTETRYTLGVNSYVDTAFTGFFDLLNYEPNNTQNSATPLTNRQTIMSYLHKNDVDMYRMNFGATAPAYRPITITNYEFYNETDKTYSKALHAGETVRLGLVIKNDTTKSMYSSNKINYKLNSAHQNISVSQETDTINNSTSSYYSFRSRYAQDITYGWDDGGSYGIYGTGKSHNSNASYLHWTHKTNLPQFSISTDCPADTTIPLTLTFTDRDSNTWSDEIFVLVK